jgi:hypothetical protein
VSTLTPKNSSSVNLHSGRKGLQGYHREEEAEEGRVIVRFFSELSLNPFSYSKGFSPVAKERDEEYLPDSQR